MAGSHEHMCEQSFSQARTQTTDGFPKFVLRREAEALLCRVVRGMQSQRGMAHPSTRRCIRDLEFILSEQGKREEAEEWGRILAETESQSTSAGDGGDSSLGSGPLPSDMSDDQVADAQTLEAWFLGTLAPGAGAAKVASLTDSASEGDLEGDVSWACLQALGLWRGSEAGDTQSSGAQG